jgi:hypothetical protein
MGLATLGVFVGFNYYQLIIQASTVYTSLQGIFIFTLVIIVYLIAIMFI